MRSGGENFLTHRAQNCSAKEWKRQQAAAALAQLTLYLSWGANKGNTCCRVRWFVRWFAARMLAQLARAAFGPAANRYGRARYITIRESERRASAGWLADSRGFSWSERGFVRAPVAALISGPEGESRRERVLTLAASAQVWRRLSRLGPTRFWIDSIDGRGIVRRRRRCRQRRRFCWTEMAATTSSAEFYGNTQNRCRRILCSATSESFCR